MSIRVQVERMRGLSMPFNVKFHPHHAVIRHRIGNLSMGVEVVRRVGVFDFAPRLDRANRIFSADPEAHGCDLGQIASDPDVNRRITARLERSISARHADLVCVDHRDAEFDRIVVMTFLMLMVVIVFMICMIVVMFSGFLCRVRHIISVLAAA